MGGATALLLFSIVVTGVLHTGSVAKSYIYLHFHIFSLSALSIRCHSQMYSFLEAVTVFLFWDLQSETKLALLRCDVHVRIHTYTSAVVEDNQSMLHDVFIYVFWVVYHLLELD